MSERTIQELEQSQDRDWEQNKKDFQQELRQVMENFCFRRFGKNDVLDQENELMELIEKVMEKYNCEPSLWGRL